MRNTERKLSSGSKTLTCNKCKLVKEVENFYIDNKNQRYYSYCKTCHKESMKRVSSLKNEEDKVKSKEYFKNYMREYRKKILLKTT
jgi:transcription elongation factor Elf1